VGKKKVRETLGALLFPIASMGLAYLPPFTININYKCR